MLLALFFLFDVECAASLVEFDVERIVFEDRVLSSGSVTNETRSVDVSYMDNRYTIESEFWTEGTVDLTNLRAIENGLVLYQQRVPLPDYYHVDTGNSEAACYDFDSGYLVMEFGTSLEPGATETIDWSYTFGLSPVSDMDGDGRVTASDIGQLLARWGEPGTGDFDGSGVVDSLDLAIMLVQWTG